MMSIGQSSLELCTPALSMWCFPYIYTKDIYPLAVQFIKEASVSAKCSAHCSQLLLEYVQFPQINLLYLLLIRSHRICYQDSDM